MVVASLASVALPMAARQAAAAEPGASAAAKEDEPPAAGPVDLSAPAPPPAPAPTPEGNWLDGPSERRCGFMIGLNLGSLLGATQGYPNDAKKIDRDEFYTDTGFSYGGMLAPWIGIALSDWFTVGIGPTFGRLQNGDSRTGFYAAGFHLDVFPAFGAGGVWRDLALTVDAGLGGFRNEDKETEDVLVEAPIASRFGLGVTWEVVQFWKMSMGPYVGFDALWSPNALRPAASLGWRSAFYAGP